MARSKAVSQVPADPDDATTPVAETLHPLPVLAGHDSLTELSAANDSPSSDLDDMLAEFSVPAAEPADSAAASSDFDDILGEFAPPPVKADELVEDAQPAPAPVDDLDSMLAEFGGADIASPPPAPVADAETTADDHVTDGDLDHDPATSGNEPPALTAEPDETSPPVDDFDDILSAFAEPAPDSALPSLTEVPVADSTATDGVADRDEPEPAAASPFDDLDDILGDFVSSAPPSASPAAADTFESLDDIFADLDDLGVLDDTGPAPEEPDLAVETDKAPAQSHSPVTTDLPLDQVPAPAVIDVTTDLPDDAHPVAKSAGKPMARRLITGAAILTGIMVSHGAAFYLGRLSMAGQALLHQKAPPGHEKAHEEHVAQPVAEHGAEAEDSALAPASDLFRYVDMPFDTKVDGKTVFQNEEIKAAIEQLDGGADLQLELEKAGKTLALAQPVHQSGDLFEVRACNRLSCDLEGVMVRYNLHTKHIGVCQTKPYVDGTGMSYTYSKWGLVEVPSCSGNPFPKGI